MPGLRKTMEEFKAGTLRSGSGHPVTDRKQALAIGLSEERALHGAKRDRTWKNRMYRMMSATR